MSDFFKRLDKYIVIKGLNDNRVTVECGISNGLIGKARNRGSLSQENISKILNKYTNLDANWLMTGTGEMIKNRCTFEQKVIPIIKIENVLEFKHCTDDEVLTDLEHNRFLSASLTSANFLVEMVDNTLLPKYANGDLVACKLIDVADIFFQWSNVYVLHSKHGIWIKKIMKGKDDNHILIISENQNYDPFELLIDDIDAVAIVLGVVHLD